MYRDGILEIAKEIKIKNASVLVTGATGLIGSCAVDVLVAANEKFNANITIYAMSRSKETVKKRFGNSVIPVVQNITTSLMDNVEYNFILHGASNADPKLYAMQPAETMVTNIIGTKNILDYCVRHKNTRMVFTSTFEVYGYIEGKEIYSEDMSGIIDQTVLRNGYPESKRSCELLIRSYVDEYKVKAVIARLPSVYGPTMLESDSKAHAQFLWNALKGEDIVLKSKGDQKRTYCYVIDVVSALFAIFEKGENGSIYNISNENSVASIAEVAELCANLTDTHVIYESPDAIESKGFSKTKSCILENSKLKELGWSGKYSLIDGLIETLEYLRANNIC